MVLGKQLDIVLALLMPQNQLIARVMLATGLRVGDVLALRTDQLAPSMRVTERKTGKTRRVRLPKSLCDAVCAQAGKEWAFPGRDGSRPKTRQAVWADIKRAQQACRLKVNLGPHSMRKAYAVELMRKYHDLSRVQKALQHDRPEVTMLYALADQLTQGYAGA